MTIMLTAVVLNCLLNPLFIFGFGWGIRGSAAATVLAQVAALSVSLIHFSSRGSFIRFERGIFRLQASVVGKIFSIGMASFLLHLCASAVVIVVNKSLREYGGDVAIGGDATGHHNDRRTGRSAALPADGDAAEEDAAAASAAGEPGDATIGVGDTITACLAGDCATGAAKFA